MAQIFSKDAQYSQADQLLPQAGSAGVLGTCNALTPPFGNCKAVVKGVMQVAPDAAATLLTLEIHRNPASENVTVTSMSIRLVAGVLDAVEVVTMGTDALPAGQDAIYQLWGFQFAGAADGHAFECFIEAELISG